MQLYRVWFGKEPYKLLCAESVEAIEKKYRRRVTQPTKIEPVRRSSEWQAEPPTISRRRRRTKV